MIEIPRFRPADLMVLILILAIAAVARIWYVGAVTDHGAGPTPLRTQAPQAAYDFAAQVEQLGQNKPALDDNLFANIKDSQRFEGLAPLANQPEVTAHVAPGYPYLVALLARFVEQPQGVLRFVQCGLGTFLAGCYYFFARRAFRSRLAAALAGLLCAINPFWIVNCAELGDGVLASTLLGFALALGTRASQVGGALASLLYGLTLAGLALVRAALLPFAIVAVLWFLLRCRGLHRGWLYALLAFLGFVNGLAPWTVRNFQVFREPMPIVDSAFVHLWIGNNPQATGGPQTEEALRAALPGDRRDALLAEQDQPKRYRMLAEDVWQTVQEDPAGTVRRRLWATLSFFFGEAWFTDPGLQRMRQAATPPADERAGAAAAQPLALPEWLENSYSGIMQISLLIMLVLGLLGWRWTFAFRREARLATIAALLVPLPYVLGHAGMLWGPRLPLDGVILCYVAFVLTCCWPPIGSVLLRNYEP